MLLTSVGYHVTNATQPSYGDLCHASLVTLEITATLERACSEAISILGRHPKLGLNMETEIDLEKVPQEYRALLKTLQDRNFDRPRHGRRRSVQPV